MSERLDIIILGATGFTGIHCIPYVHKMAKLNGQNLTWGVSGRSEAKLKEILDQMGKKVGTNLAKIPIVICDIKDYESLLKMAKRAKIIINCCGPYKYLGEPVVKACIEAGTHQLDVTGEPQYMLDCELKYNKIAKDKGVYIVSACGVDCIPGDLGVVHLQQNFTGTLNSVVFYAECWKEKSAKKLSGPSFHYGTWESFIECFANWGELTSLKQKLELKNMPNFKPKVSTSFIPHKAKAVNGWGLPFLGADEYVIQRTQLFMYEHESKRPVQINTQVLVQSFWYVIVSIFIGLILFIMSHFNFTKKLLLDYPEIFSFGLFSKKRDPSEEVLEKTWFQITFYGEGWKDKLADKDDQYNENCNHVMVSRVKGRNPGYGVTCACVVGAAIVLATEADKIPIKGGFLTAGMAFSRTSLIKLLNEYGVTFEILSEKDL